MATECFFESPVAMAEHHPELYELLRYDEYSRFDDGIYNFRV